MIVMEAITVAVYVIILVYIWTRNGKKFSRREMSITLQVYLFAKFLLRIFSKIVFFYSCLYRQSTR